MGSYVWFRLLKWCGVGPTIGPCRSCALRLVHQLQVASGLEDGVVNRVASVSLLYDEFFVAMFSSDHIRLALVLARLSPPLPKVSVRSDSADGHGDCTLDPNGRSSPDPRDGS